MQPSQGTEACPKCGIQRRYLDECHPNNLAAVNACPDPFHNESRKRQAELEESHA